MKKKGKIILIVIAILIFIIIGIMIYLNHITIPKESKEDVITQEEEQEQEAEMERLRLRQMQEGDRIKTYVGKYMKCIEKKDYKAAYDLLYDPFKQSYFPTLEDYEKYIKDCNFPEMLAVEYNDIRTRGDYYIVTIGIGSLFDSSTRISELTIVLKEDNYNEFKLSFKKTLEE